MVFFCIYSSDNEYVYPYFEFEAGISFTSFLARRQSMNRRFWNIELQAYESCNYYVIHYLDCRGLKRLHSRKGKHVTKICVRDVSCSAASGSWELERSCGQRDSFPATTAPRLSPERATRSFEGIVDYFSNYYDLRFLILISSFSTLLFEYFGDLAPLTFNFQGKIRSLPLAIVR